MADYSGALEVLLADVGAPSRRGRRALQWWPDGAGHRGWRRPSKREEEAAARCGRRERRGGGNSERQRDDGKMWLPPLPPLPLRLAG